MEEFEKKRQPDAPGSGEEAGFPEPNRQWALFGQIGVFALSLQGASHLRSGAPCQDNNGFVWLEEAGLLLCAIADGVGSCAHSHWGARTAVAAVLDALGRELKALSGGKPVRLEKCGKEKLEGLFHRAFLQAQEAVGSEADSRGLLALEFQSTLTAAVYDGRRLACCHIGDDGIVAQGTSGNYALITSRMKGEEANSVMTLQSGCREILLTTTDIAGFLMTTDGVLDAYVSGKALGNLIYYPFFEKLIYGMRPGPGGKARSAVRGIFEEMRTGPDLAGITSDDITVVAVANLALLDTGVHPVFSREEFEEKSLAFQRARAEKLYPPKRRETPEPGKQAEIPPDIPAERSPVEEDPVTEATAPRPPREDILRGFFGGIKQKEIRDLRCRYCRKRFSVKSGYRYCPFCGSRLTR